MGYFFSAFETTRSKANDPSLCPICPGQYLICTDSGDLFYDTQDGVRKHLTDIIDLQTDTERTAILAPLDKMYFVKETAHFWRYLNGEWVDLCAATTNGGVGESREGVAQGANTDGTPIATGGVGSEVFNDYRDYKFTVSVKQGNISGGEYSHTEGSTNRALGNYSHAEGFNCLAEEIYSHSEGQGCDATGEASHSEGYNTNATGKYSHAEGYGSMASGEMSHAEGYSVASGKYAHSEGNGNQASGPKSHAEGEYTQALGEWSHTEGVTTYARGMAAHAEGGAYLDDLGEEYADVIGGPSASGRNSHAEGCGTSAIGHNSHAEGCSCAASGNDSHAEGFGTYARAKSSHAEGYKSAININAQAAHAEGGVVSTADGSDYTITKGNIASGKNSHVEGAASTASGLNSHAEGYNCVASGAESHAEGFNCQAKSRGSHAEGMNTVAEVARYTSNDESLRPTHAEGEGTVASGVCSHAEGHASKASGPNSHAEGSGCSATGTNSHSEGISCNATGANSHSEGAQNESSGHCSHAEGDSNTVRSYAGHVEGAYCTCEAATFNSQQIPNHAEGWHTTASNIAAHAEGWYTTASGEASHAGGMWAIASGNASVCYGGYINLDSNGNAIGSCESSGYGSFAGGTNSFAGGHRSFAFGDSTLTTGHSQMAIGIANIAYGSGTLFIIGKGTRSETTITRANCFRVDKTAVYSSGNYNTSGADYAEMFEWEDGNPDHEDRVGRFVTLHGEKISLAKPGDTRILGIVSGMPSVCGDVYDDQWQGMFLRDVFGRPIWEDVEVVEELGGEGEHRYIDHREKLNPEHDPEQIYIPRSDRPEWDAVGMLGKLVMVDDGTAQVDGFVKPGHGGVATASSTETKYYVMARLDETHIRVLVL